MTTPQIVVIGSGVLGLSAAYVLKEQNPDYSITVVARDLIEDFTSQGWSSPWAGANWCSFGNDERTNAWEEITFRKLVELIPQGLVMWLPARQYFKSSDALADIWYQHVVGDFKVIEPSALPPGCPFGVSYTTVSLKPKEYMGWLKSELDKKGVRFVRKHVESIAEAAAVNPGGTQVIINATGLGAKSLGGVEDPDVYPIRGQTVLINAPNIKQCVMGIDDKDVGDEVTYIIPRPDGTVICGGTFQDNSWDLAVDPQTKKGILERCQSVLPELLEDATIISDNVGLRPARKGGPRVELEHIPLAGDNTPQESIAVVHAYGIGPAGFQSAWGIAEEVASLVQKGLSRHP